LTQPTSRVPFLHVIPTKGENMVTRKKIQVDFEYEEVLDAKTRRLIQVGCAVAVGCPT